MCHNSLISTNGCYLLLALVFFPNAGAHQEMRKMPKRTYSLGLKKEAIAFMDQPGETAYSAEKYFLGRDCFEYDVPLFYQW